MNNVPKGMLIFDVDGTLCDTKPGIFRALEAVFVKFGLGDFDRSSGNQYIGPPIRESMIKYARLSEEEAEQATEYYRNVYVENYIADSKTYEGVSDLVSSLKDAGYALSIATMKTYKQVEKIFDEAILDRELFDYVETALENGKLSKSDMIKRISHACGEGVPVVMIGDTEGDRKAAEAAGVNFIGVTYGYGYKTGSEHLFQTVDHVRDISGVIKAIGM